MLFLSLPFVGTFQIPVTLGSTDFFNTEDHIDSNNMIMAISVVQTNIQEKAFISGIRLSLLFCLVWNHRYLEAYHTYYLLQTQQFIAIVRMVGLQLNPF